MMAASHGPGWRFWQRKREAEFERLTSLAKEAIADARRAIEESATRDEEELRRRREH